MNSVTLNLILQLLLLVCVSGWLYFFCKLLKRYQTLLHKVNNLEHDVKLFIERFYNINQEPVNEPKHINSTECTR